MRIISKKHDYYDGVMVYGTDPSVIFERKSTVYYNLKEFDIGLETYLLQLFGLFKRYNRTVRPFVVIFCGKMYCGMGISVKDEKAKHTHNAYDWCCSGYTDVHCYNAEDVLKVAEENNIDVEGSFPAKVMVDGKFVKLSLIQKTEMFFGNSGSNKFMNLMVGERCPILLVEDADDYRAKLKGERNPVLKNVEFFKVFDPYTTYQNLSMFIGGILAKETNPMVNISDADMVVKKGFNKWSFRRMKGDKR